MFEAYNVLFYYLICEAVLALYAHGVTIRVAFDSGNGVSPVAFIGLKLKKNIKEKHNVFYSFKMSI